jgi:GTPase
LNPLVGKIKFIDDFEFTMSDIPGIIENSHLNKGLGLDFLRHIERTKVLIFVLDLQEPEPWKTLEILRRELLMYKPDFLERPAFVVANKADLDIEAETKFSIL